MTLRSRRAMWVLATVLATTSAAAPAAVGVPSAPASTPSAYVRATAPDPVPQDPQQFLQRAARGEVALDRLGTDLAEVAALNDMTARGLTRLLLEDPTAWVDPTGRVFYKDPAPAAIEAEVPAEAPHPYNQTFQLHSKPGSSKTIYLDFTGQTVSGTIWNTWMDSTGSTVLFPSPQVVPGLSLDGDATTFSDAERDLVQSVWQRVSEDYAPFDVDVTTADPGIEALRRSSPDDSVFGTQVVISPSTPAATVFCNNRCGGIAYIGTFATSESDYYQPAWVFPHNLSYDAKSIAEAATHEVGHNLGLEHDGLTPDANSYFQGHGAWAPIMGGAYNRPISQWSKGEYATANELQDDLAVITDNGLSFVPDDHGGSLGSATSVTSPDRTATGVISTPTDTDYLAFGQGCAGPVTVSVSPAPTSPNLDVRLRLLSADGTQLALSDPPSAMTTRDVASGLGASAQVTVAAGSTLYAEVDGVGAGDKLSTGYSDYASLGRYTITSTGCTADAPPVVAFQQASQSAGETAGTVQLTVTRTGNTTLPASVGYARTGGTASTGTDFTLTAGTLGFAAGETSKTIPVAIVDDSAEETSETVEVTLSNPGAGTALGSTTRTTLTITDDDAPATVSFEQATASADEDAGTVDLLVTRSGNTARASTVDYASSGSTATADDDFTLTAGTLAFSPGQTQKAITVALVDDALPEADETVTVTLGSPSSGTVLGQRSSTTLTITDDDDQAVVGFAQAARTVDEDAGTLQLTVVRTGNPLLPASVDYQHSGGTASPVSDFLSGSGTLTFDAGETEQTIELTVADDGVAESAESVQLTLSNPSTGTALGTTATTLTIATSDQQPDATISTRSSAGYVGNDVFNASGAGQTKGVTAGRGQVRSFFVRVTNDGTTRNRILLLAGKPGRGAVATYLTGGVDVTAVLTHPDGGYVDLLPDQAVLIKVNLKVGRTTKVGSVKSVPVTATWVGDGTRSDVVKASVTVRR